MTAALLVIGDEILSGRTKDKNIGYIAEYLTNIGIDLKEVRVVPDEEPEIVTALNALRARYTYVFTTGGIGPTHDDITADCVAKAFGVRHRPRSARRRDHDGARATQTGGVMNEARMRMTRAARRRRAGAQQGLGGAGFLDRQRHRHGRRAAHHADDARIRDAEAQDRHRACCRNPCAPTAAKAISAPSLASIAKQHPDVVIGSYPFMDEKIGGNTNVVVRSRGRRRSLPPPRRPSRRCWAGQGGACGRQEITAASRRVAGN